MRYIVNDRLVLMRPPEGPLAAFIRPFSDWVIEQGYQSDSLRQRVRVAATFSRWLGRRALEAPNVHAQHCAEYLRYRRRRRKLGRGDAVALGQFKNFLCEHGVLPPLERHAVSSRFSSSPWRRRSRGRPCGGRRTRVQGLAGR